jgi:hypothetical protein
MTPDPWERKLSLTIFAFALAMAFILGFCAKEADSATMATTQSREPWTIAQCDRLLDRHARAVYNVSMWNRGGWPLWRVVCL